jgi:hypothetical protein
MQLVPLHSGEWCGVVRSMLRKQSAQRPTADEMLGRAALTPGCRIVAAQVWLHSLPGVRLFAAQVWLHSLPGVRLVTWTILAVVINRCFDCKIT